MTLDIVHAAPVLSLTANVTRLQIDCTSLQETCWRCSSLHASSCCFTHSTQSRKHRRTRQQQISRQEHGIAPGNGLRCPGAPVSAGGLAAAAAPAGEAWPGRRACAGPLAVTSAVAAFHAAPGSEALGSQRLGTAWRAAAAGPTCACTMTKHRSAGTARPIELEAAQAEHAAAGLPVQHAAQLHIEGVEAGIIREEGLWGRDGGTPEEG